MTTHDNKAVVRSFYEDEERSRGDLALVDGWIGAGLRVSLPGRAEPMGLAEYRDRVAAAMRAFPDIGFDVHEQVAAATDRPYAVAVLADIHGNLAALRAVLADLACQPYDRVAIAGDLVLNGPRPAETVDVLRGLEATIVYGNSDRGLVNQEFDRPDARWVRQAIGPARIAWLAALPFDCRITPPGRVSADDDLLVVHATPTDVTAVLTVEPDGQGLLHVTPEEQARRLLGDTRANLIVAGHVHYASSGTAAGRRFATIGSVGFPWDGDHRAAYALVAWDGRAWQVQHRRVAYDHLSVVEDLRRTGAPFAEESAQRLLRARFRPELVP